MEEERSNQSTHKPTNHDDGSSSLSAMMPLTSLTTVKISEFSSNEDVANVLWLPYYWVPLFKDPRVRVSTVWTHWSKLCCNYLLARLLASWCSTYTLTSVFAWLHPPTQFVGVSDYYFTTDDGSETKARIRTHATSNGYRFELTFEFEVCYTPMFCVGKHTVLHAVFSHL